MLSEYERVWKEMHEKPKFIEDAERARANDPGKMHLRSTIKQPERYEWSEMAYDDFDAADANADWAELDQAIQDYIDEMSDVELSEGEDELSDTEDMSGWVVSDSDYDPTDDYQPSESDHCTSETDECEM